MLINTQELDEGAELQTAICVVGGGVAGISLALALARAGLDTVLLESGGLEPDDATRDLYRGRATGLPYAFADGCRSRYLGGSSNCWGGWCRPLDAWDFTARDWIPHSGWPFDLGELAPYYARTHALLKLGPQSFDPAWWETAIGRADVRRLPLVTGKIRDTISQFSPPARFGSLYRDDLHQTPDLRVLLHANALQVETDSAGSEARAVRVASLRGRHVRIRAQRIVLAAGGIENARLLLASNQTQAEGLGNAHDLVGRYFMDHPRMMSGSLRFARAWERNKLYDIKYHYHNRAVSAGGTRIAAQFALRPEVQAQERLLNARVWFCSVFHGEGSAGAQALYRCKQALLQKEQPGWSLPRDVLEMLSQPVQTLAYGMTRLVQPRALIRGVRFQSIVEPEPDPASRVTLSRTEVDRLGMPRVEVHWRLGDAVKRTFDRTLHLLAEDLRASGVAEVSLDEDLAGRDWPTSIEREGTWHHMGTTRMHDSPREGVVDRNSRVHGMHNLYVAGSSVFPTAGANFPTITIAALVLRLADHLIQLARQDGLLRPASVAQEDQAASVGKPVIARCGPARS